jgi:hypothetical protein
LDAETWQALLGGARSQALRLLAGTEDPVPAMLATQQLLQFRSVLVLNLLAQMVSTLPQ